MIIDLADLELNVPKFFSHKNGDTGISFFVIKTEKGASAFLDACTKCYAQKKGFGFDSGSVACRACNERYPLSEIEKGFGSCYPIKLGGRTEGNRYLISIADIENLGAKFFR